MKENQRIYAAAARSRDAFCVAVVEPERDDPYAFLLSYDGAFQQPWARVDVQRIVNGLAVAGGDGASPAFVAVSDEGDVFFLEPRQPVTEKIAGAGILSPDATGLGSIVAVAEIAGRLYVCGESAQLYRRDALGTWTPVSGPGLSPEPGYSSIRLKAVAGASQDAIYVCGSATPAQRQLTAADYKQMEEAGKRGDTQRIIEIMNSTRDAGVDYTYEGRAYFWNGVAWSRIALPERHSLDDILIESPGKVWLTGFHGTILCGTASTGFQDVGFRGDTETVLSFTKFGDRYVAASDNALHWFNGHNLSPLRPTTLTRIATPLKVQAADGVLFYFDYNQGVHRFDGAAWTAIPIPPELLERTFTGLPRP